MRRSLATFLVLVGALTGQNQPNPSPPKPAPSKESPEQPGGVFRIQSQWPPDAEAPKKEEPPKKAVLTFEGKPMILPFACTDEDITAFGMTCTEEHPCPVYAQLSGLQPLGSKLFVTGNLHDGATTMYSLLLVSEDNGRTWEEPVDRMRGAGLEHIQFIDFETGWISGELLQALPRDPFFLLTTDGGKSWRRRPVYSEARIGAIDQFHFESRTAGTLVIDRMQSGEAGRFERYESMTGGDTWMIREVTQKRPRLRVSQETYANPDWRLQADAKSKAHRVERKNGARWETVAAFTVKVGECKPALSTLPEPPPAAPAPITAPAGRLPAPTGPSRPPTLKKKN